MGLSGPNLELLQQVAALVSLFKVPVVLAGDFNMEASDLMQQGWTEHLGLVPMLPEGTTSTCSPGKRVLDFFLVSPVVVALATCEP
eukprot:8118042-Lingulodinium_polyedra.AAC.1